MSVQVVGPNNRLQLFTPTGNRMYFDQVTTNLWAASKPAYVTDTIVKDDTAGTYALKYPNGGNSTFSSATGKWLSTSDRFGNTIAGTYDESGNLVTITDPEGRQVTLEYTSNLISRVLLPGGAAWVFTYTAMGPTSVLTSITDPVNPTQPWRTFSYEGQSDGVYRSLTAVRDSAGKLLEGHAYETSGDNRGRTSVAEGGRDSYTFEYDTPSAGQTRVTRTINGTTTQVAVYTLQRLAGTVVPTRIEGVCPSCGTVTDSQTFVVDSVGRPISVTDAGGQTTRYTYDPYGSILTKTEAAGTARERTTTFWYERPTWPSFVTKTTSPSATGNGLKTIEYQWNQDETILTSSVTGNLSADPNSTTTYTRSTTFDSKHRVITEDGPRQDASDVTTYTYYADTDPLIERRGRLQQATNAVGLSTTFDNYDIYGTARLVTDPNGVVTQVQTDARGRVTGTTSKAVSGDPNENTDYVTSSTFDARDRVTERTNPRDATTRYLYEDGTNRLTDVVRLTLTGNEVERKHLTFNVAGNKTSEQDQLCTSPAPTCTTWSTNRTISYVYDNKDRLIEVDQPLPSGAKILYQYDADGRLETVQDENHATPNTTYAYDELSRLSTVTQALAGAPGGTAVTRYNYDAADNLTSVTDPNGNITTYAYDDFGRLQTQNSSVTGTTTYTYDPAGNLLTTTDANGANTTRTYDAGNRITSATASRTGSATEAMTWTYDDATAGNYGRGRLASMTDASGSTTYRYDRRGLTRYEQKTIAGTAYTTTYAYDAAGNRTRIVYPSGRAVDYTFDFADRPATATTGTTSLVTATTYAPFGPATQIVYGNGTTKTFSYDTRYRPIENKLTGGTGVIADYQYAEDAVGNITQIHDGIDSSFNRDFAYDELNRLTTANSGTSLWGNGTYQYDPLGNILSLDMGRVRTASFTYVGTPPKLATVTENGTQSTVTYDPAGNETNVAGKTYTYSARSQLTDAQDVSYVYDGRGIRTITAIPAGPVDIALTLTPSAVYGGDSSTGAVTLSAAAPSPGVTVWLSSDNELLATVPASVAIASGATSASFTISTTTQNAIQNVAIRARVVGSDAAATLTVNPRADVTSLTFDRSLIDGGTTATGTVTITGVVPPGGALITLTSSNPAAASVPPSITIPSNETSGTFTLTSYSVAVDSPVTITASAINTISTTVTIRANPVTVSGLTVAPQAVVGGLMNAIGTVQLNQPALPGGIVVILSSSNTNVATVPVSVTVPEGSPSAAFTIATSTVGASTPVTIGATYATTMTVSLTVIPCSDWAPGDAVLGSGERVWIEDAIPTGGQPVGTWTWDTNRKASGTQSNTIGPGTGLQQYYFVNATDTMPIDTATEAIVVYALLDPCNPPQEILFQFNTGGSWEHRAYWGANIVPYGTNGTNSRRRLGDLPPLGQWVRLVVPISRVGLGGTTVNGMAFDVVDGRAWFDRVARVTCLTNVPPPSSFPPGEVVWVEDAVPSGASTSGVWIWDTAQKASGTASNTDVVIDTLHQHYFVNATNGISIGVGDTLFAYALISPCDPPDEIVLQWNDGTWEHRGYWGANLFPYGIDGTDSRRRMGDLPAAGQWVRLEIPASQIGLEGHTVRGLSFDTMGGKVWYDHVGVKPAGSGAVTPAPAATTTRLRGRFWTALRRLTRRQPAPPMSLFMASSIVAQDATPKQRYSLYTPELNLLAETTTANATNLPIAYEYVWFGGAPLAQIETATGTIHWYFNDHLGAPILTTNASGAVDWRVEREPYGKTFVRVGTDRHQPLGFPGQESDENAPDRQYNIFRWYRSEWGRYTQADPIGLEEGGINPYAYAEENPISSADPNGLAPCNPAQTQTCSEGCTKRGKTFKSCSLNSLTFCGVTFQWTWCECKDWQKKCPPCAPPPPPRIDKVPPSKPHYPCPGDHWTYFEVHQAPYPKCTCRTVQRFGGCL